MRKYSKRTIAAVAAVTVAGSGLAYAYWTAGGSGTGSATTAADAAALVIKQTSTVTAMAPGVAAQPLSGVIDNPNNEAVFVGGVTATVTVATAPAAVGTCDATDYTLVQPTRLDRQIPAGNAAATWSGGSIAFNNKLGTNQNGCKGATVTLTYSIS